MGDRTSKSACCGAKTKVDPRWDTRYCTMCGAWLERLCECTRQDYERGDCRIDKWSDERPVRKMVERADEHARQVMILGDWVIALSIMSPCILILVACLLVYGLIFPSIGLTVLYGIVIWARHRCRRKRQEHLDMLNKETSDGG